jgi:hypothetical protein
MEAAETAVVAEPTVEAPMVAAVGWVDSEVAPDMGCQRTDRSRRSDSPIQRRLRCSPSHEMDRCQSSVDRGSTAPQDCLCRRPAQGLLSRPTEIEAAAVAFVEMRWGPEVAAVAAAALEAREEEVMTAAQSVVVTVEVEAVGLVAERLDAAAVDARGSVVAGMVAVARAAAALVAAEWAVEA